MTAPTVDELKAITEQMWVAARAASTRALMADVDYAKAVNGEAQGDEATAIITMRVPPKVKAQLVATAAARRMSLTRYLVDGGLEGSSSQNT